MIFLEAKTSFPNPESSIPGNLARYNEEITDICDKFIHSLNLYSSVKAGVAEEKLPDVFNAQDKVRLVFVLVVRNHEIEWCIPVRKKLLKKLPPYLKKIWRPKVYVINCAEAVKQQLVAVNRDESS